MLTGNVATTVHGRYLYENRGAERLLVGFHGYAEVAEWNFAELARIPGVERWSLVSIQALHPFYTRSGEVVANWMTKQDRELAIADNLAYVQAVLAALPQARQLVFSGFSQGAAMAARAAGHISCAGLMMLGGDVPPDVQRDDVRLPPVLLGRGTRDEWYTEEKFQADLAWLEPRTRVTRCVFAGGHEWSDPFREAAGEFLKERDR
ncbi:MAG TPA: phospholipase [Thermoanaerobaculia bacterium]|nr:phospholipase [Thermoanaerobaculia bacterium]